MWLSIIAHKRLFAAVIACKSPVKCKLISDMGTTCAYPPPAAPPLMPNTGPRDGSLKARHTFLPSLDMPSASPIETVVFPSPPAVGFIAVTNTSLDFGSVLSKFILALYFPYISIRSSSNDSFFAISRMSFILQFSAISISVSISHPLNHTILYFIL